VDRWARVSVGVSLAGARTRHLRYHNPAGHADCQRVTDVMSDFPSRPGRSPGVCLPPLAHLSRYDAQPTTCPNVSDRSL
jgi:hypothetical protein